MRHTYETQNDNGLKFSGVLGLAALALPALQAQAGDITMYKVCGHRLVPESLER